MELENIDISQIQQSPKMTKYINVKNMLDSETQLRNTVEQHVEKGFILDPNNPANYDQYGDYIQRFSNNYIHCENPNCIWNSYIPEPSFTNPIDTVYEHTINGTNGEILKIVLCSECHRSNEYNICSLCGKVFDKLFIELLGEFGICQECKVNEFDENHSFEKFILNNSFRTEIEKINLYELLEDEHNSALFYKPIGETNEESDDEY
jgi:hypothetical protein